MNHKPKKLLDQVRDVIRIKHYSQKTEVIYIHWIRKYILFYNKRHPKDMGVPEIEAFLTHLAVNQKVAASTQNQAFSAILHLYREVLGKPVETGYQNIGTIRSKRLLLLPPFQVLFSVQFGAECVLHNRNYLPNGQINPHMSNRIDSIPLHITV